MAAMEPSTSLAGVITRIRENAGLDVAFGGAVSPREDGFVIDCAAGDRVEPLDGLGIESGTGLGGKALVLVRPARVTDYANAAGITHHYDRAVSEAGLRSVLAVPVVTAGVARAMVYGALRGAVPISDVQLSIVHRCVKEYEYELRVDDEVRHRMAERGLETTIARLRTQLDDISAATDTLARQVADPELRARIEAMGRLAKQGAPGHAAGSGSQPISLTPREREVLAEVAAGSTNAEAAQRLGLVVSTVKAYLKSAMRKMGARNRTELVALCRRAGMIP
jgi:LuxR family transcriptional regulator, regulator of acetate metabolism